MHGPMGGFTELVAGCVDGPLFEWEAEDEEEIVYDA